MIYKKEEMNGKMMSKTVIAEKQQYGRRQRIDSEMKWLSNKGEVESDLQDS